jgi:sugar/nucleoside kinase (ribokinase family)
MCRPHWLAAVLSAIVLLPRPAAAADTFDLIYTDLPEFPALGREVTSGDLIATGGAMYITAASLQRLGVQVAWAGVFGNDYYSEYVRQMAIREALDLSLAKRVDQPYRRVTTSILPGRTRLVTYIDPPPIDLTPLADEMQRCAFAHLHLGGILTIEC